MSNLTQDIVGKLWNLCNVLKDDGVTYHQYVTELTYLLFLKMAKETATERDLPEKYRWDVLESKPGSERLTHYKLMLVQLGTEGSVLVQQIYANASSFIKKPTTLSTLVTEIDKINWYEARKEGLGDLYEGLLEKNANEKKSGAGQYFTPRHLIDSMVALMQPTLKDVIQDPAAGARIVYYWAVRRDLILLLYAYPKNVTADLTPKQIRQLASVIKEEFSHEETDV